MQRSFKLKREQEAENMRAKMAKKLAPLKATPPSPAARKKVRSMVEAMMRSFE